MKTFMIVLAVSAALFFGAIGIWSSKDLQDQVKDSKVIEQCEKIRDSFRLMSSDWQMFENKCTEMKENFYKKHGVPY